MGKRLLDFDAKISDVKQINPLFSTCKVRVLYTGKNRNMSTIAKDTVEKALPTLKNIPIVGEYSVENKDFKGHGGAIDLNDYKFIHTTKPYGVVPESATYQWVDIKGRDGATRTYLEVDGCYLWTGRYEEAYSVIENGKGQSMEIEVTDGTWDDNEESYVIKNFNFSALCILGDDVEPAFEDASITAYSFNKDSFLQEYTLMLSELKTSLNKEKEVNVMLKDLLLKYSTTMEELTEKGLNFSEISEDDLEAKIAETLGVDVIVEGQQNDPTDPVDPPTDPVDPPAVDPEPVDTEALQARIVALENDIQAKDVELNSLREFKLNVERADHEDKVQKMFSNFQLTDEDVNSIDIHEFSLEEIEEKCYAILGRKLANKKDFSKNQKDGTFRLPLNNGNEDEDDSHENSRYGDIFKK